jgi:hypothetical protein
MLSSTLKAEYSALLEQHAHAAGRALAAIAAGGPAPPPCPRGCSSPRIWRSSTVLPVPEPPTRASISPR